MIELDDLILTSTDFCSKSEEIDIDSEIEKMFARNKLISAYYQQLRNDTLTKGFVEELCDCLDENGVDPYSWWEQIESNITCVIGKPELYVL